MRITGCPVHLISREVRRANELADLYRKGLPPIAGGSLDQSNWFVELCNFTWSERARIRAKLGWTGE